MERKENLYNANVTINRIADLSDFTTDSIVRVPIHTKAQAKELLNAGVAIYEKVVELPNGAMHKHYYCEVLLSNLCEVALK